MTTLLKGQAALLPLCRKIDSRGTLIPFDLAALPFTLGSIFAIRDVPVGTTRGGHRRRTTRQLLVCLSGQVDVLLRYRGEEQAVRLADGDCGLVIEANVWAEQTYVLPQSVLLVLGSGPYDPADYASDPL